MKVALSIPDDLFESAETLSRRLRVTRSRLYATALAEFLAKHRTRRITERLDAVYGDSKAGLDPGVRRLQRRSVGRDEW
jgi:metal-responsive CopG/Arc/MetJ family transcriptional regulator